MLTSKQRAYLRSLGNSMDPVFQIGKGGITEELITQLDNVLEKRELIKVRVLKNCPELPEELAEQAGHALNADVVQKIGRNFLLYRESLENVVLELP